LIPTAVDLGTLVHPAAPSTAVMIYSAVFENCFL
jgi:hypothetical protein